MDESPYRETAPLPPVPPDPYLLVWEDHRRRMRIRRFLWPAWLLVTVALVFCTASFWLLLTIFWGAVFADGFYCRQGTCPRCGKRFDSYPHEFVMRRAASRETVQCRHCGLPFGTRQRSALPWSGDAPSAQGQP